MRICRWRLQVVSHKVKGWILFSFSPADLEQKNIKKSNRKCIWQKTKRKHEWILKIKIEQKVLKRQHIMFNAIYLRSNANTLVSLCVCVCVWKCISMHKFMQFLFCVLCSFAYTSSIIGLFQVTVVRSYHLVGLQSFTKMTRD